MSVIFKWINILFSIGIFSIGMGMLYIAIPYFGNQALIVSSGSMSPTIDAGSIVVVRPANELITPQENKIPLYNKDDIIAFRGENNSNTIITHRVVGSEIKENGIFYKTKGDANEEVDSWLVRERNILGKTFFILPEVGYFLAFAKSDLGFPLVVILPAAFVILLEVSNVVKELRSLKKIRITEIRAHLRHPAGHKGERSHFPGLKIFVPLLMIGLAIPIAFAFPTDTEKSTNNVFTAAKDFSTPTPSSTILTATPSGEVQASSSSGEIR